MNEQDLALNAFCSNEKSAQKSNIIVLYPLHILKTKAIINFEAKQVVNPASTTKTILLSRESVYDIGS